MDMNDIEPVDDSRSEDTQPLDTAHQNITIGMDKVDAAFFNRKNSKKRDWNSRHHDKLDKKTHSRNKSGDQFHDKLMPDYEKKRMKKNIEHK